MFNDDAVLPGAIQRLFYGQYLGVYRGLAQKFGNGKVGLVGVVYHQRRLSSEGFKDIAFIAQLTGNGRPERRELQIGSVDLIGNGN